MWPSLETASHVFDWAGFVLVGALLAGVVCTVLIVWMGIVKERHWEDEKRYSAERIALNEKETTRAIAESDKAKEGAALANERAAEANARALEAQLALEKYKTPRSLSSEQQARITAKMKAFAGTPFDFLIQADPEPIGLMEQIGTALSASGLVWEPWRSGVYGTPVFNPPGLPQTGIIATSGLMIQIDNSKAPQWGAAVVALKDALLAEGVEAEARGITDGSDPPNAIHIYIGRKPQ